MSPLASPAGGAPLRVHVPAADDASGLHPNDPGSVNPPGRIIDFRAGKSMWGHAMHAATWSPEPPRVTGHLWWRRVYDRVSVLCHTSPPPEVGNLVLYTTARSPERFGRIVEVKPLYNPRDMFEIVMEAAGWPSSAEPSYEAAQTARPGPGCNTPSYGEKE